MAWKSLWKGPTGDKSPPVPEKNRGWTGQSPSKSVQPEENHEKAPRWSWAGTIWEMSTNGLFPAVLVFFMGTLDKLSDSLSTGRGSG
jgi:hypothetical protein